MPLPLRPSDLDLTGALPVIRDGILTYPATGVVSTKGVRREAILGIFAYGIAACTGASDVLVFKGDR